MQNAYYFVIPSAVEDPKPLAVRCIIRYHSSKPFFDFDTKV